MRRTEKQYLADIERRAQARGLSGSGSYIVGHDTAEDETEGACTVCGGRYFGRSAEITSLLGEYPNFTQDRYGRACWDCVIWLANGDLSGHDFAPEPIDPTRD